MVNCSTLPSVQFIISLVDIDHYLDSVGLNGYSSQLWSLLHYSQMYVHCMKNGLGCSCLNGYRDLL